MLVNNQPSDDDQPTSDTTDAHPVHCSARKARENSVRWVKALLAPPRRMLEMETELIYYYHVFHCFRS